MLRRIFLQPLQLPGFRFFSGKAPPPEVLPLIAIFGRPNVGKSALFNRLVGRREAIVHDTPAGHVTRDYREGLARLGDLSFRVADTCGLETDPPPGSIQERASVLTARALSHADAILLVVDAKTGILPGDESLARWLRMQSAVSKSHVIPVANKCEGGSRRDQLASVLAETVKLGFGEAVGISAETGEGMADLYTSLQPVLDPIITERAAAAAAGSTIEQDAQPAVLRLAIMGLPNVGKSTLINQLLGEERCLTGPEPGLTRDAIKARVNFKGQDVELVDTAGWLKKTSLPRHDESGGQVAAATLRGGHSVLRLAHAVALVVDARCILESGRGLTHREAALASSIVQEGRVLVLVANKVDELDKGQSNEAIKLLKDSADRVLPDAGGAAVFGVSALTGENTQQLLSTVLILYEKWCKRVSTSTLNMWLKEKVIVSKVAGGGGKESARVKYLSQIKARPPTFVAWSRGSAPFPETGRRALANAIREDFGFDAIVVRLLIRKGRQK